MFNLYGVEEDIANKMIPKIIELFASNNLTVREGKGILRMALQRMDEPFEIAWEKAQNQKITELADIQDPSDYIVRIVGKAIEKNSNHFREKLIEALKNG